MNNADEFQPTIASADLRPGDIPEEDAQLEALEAFCLTIDGYEGETRSVDDLIGEAERIERDGLEKATVDELRAIAFIRQRELRWTTYGDEAADAPLIAKIRRAIAEIRRRVA